MANLTTNQKPVNLQALIDFGSGLKTQIDNVATSANAAIKSVSVNNGVISFFTSTDGTGTAVGTVSFPEELVLDQVKTKFEPSFAFSAVTYPGANDPNKDGKPVLVVAVKGTEPGQTATTTYSFIDFSALADTYTAKAGDSAKILNISGYEIEFKISATAGNILTVNNDGLYVTNRVAGATQNNLVSFDANGAPADSGIAKGDVLTTSNIATNTEVQTALASIFGNSGQNEG